MWELNNLLNHSMENMVKINDKWTYARPLNYTKKYTSLKDRIKRAWKVFTCKADCFMWPEGQ